jgi:hypothetical protein
MTAVSQAELANLIALSDERDQWMRRLLAAEREAYRRGYDAGRADACVTLAEITDRETQVAWWRSFAAATRRIIQAETDPAARMREVMAEIHEDQKFVREARVRQATKPGSLRPAESSVLRRIRYLDPGNDAA